MCLISVPNLKKSIHEKGVFAWLKVTFVKRCKEEEEEEEKGEENRAIFRNTYLTNYWADFFQIWYVASRIWRA